MATNGLFLFPPCHMRLMREFPQQGYMPDFIISVIQIHIYYLFCCLFVTFVSLSPPSKELKMVGMALFLILSS